jgi:ribose transport system permease protein
LNFLGNGYLGVIPISVIIMFVLVFWGYIFTKKTKTGRNLYAVGNNEKSSALSGINIGRTKMAAYLITGALVGFAGIIQAGNIMMADPMTGYGWELDVVVACVIGGASLYGGSGTILGVLIGSMLMGVLKNGFILLGVAAYWQTIAIGAIVIILLYVDVMRKKRAGETD